MVVRTMCVWSSKTNTSWGTPFSAYAAVSYISTGLTLKSFLPYTSFIARNDAASPPVPMRNLRRLVPSLLAASSASSLTRYSTCFWSSVCGCAMDSPLETIRVGTGATNGSVSAGATRLCCASLSHESSSRLSGGRREFDHIELLPHWWVLNPPYGSDGWRRTNPLATLAGMVRAAREQRAGRAGREQRPGSTDREQPSGSSDREQPSGSSDREQLPGRAGRAALPGHTGRRGRNSRLLDQMGSLIMAVFLSTDKQPLPQPRPRWRDAHPRARHPGDLHRIVTPVQ